MTQFQLGRGPAHFLWAEDLVHSLDGALEGCGEVLKFAETRCIAGRDRVPVLRGVLDSQQLEGDDVAGLGRRGDKSAGGCGDLATPACKLNRSPPTSLGRVVCPLAGPEVGQR